MRQSDLQDISGVGEKTAEKIMAVVEAEAGIPDDVQTQAERAAANNNYRFAYALLTEELE